MQERKKRPPTRKVETYRGPMPARSDVEEERRAGGLAMDLAMKWLSEGTAPAQIVTHFLKINSQKEQAELLKIQKEIALLEAKTEAVQAAKDQDDKYQEVIRAISAYAGKEQEWEIVEDEAPEYDD